MAHLTFAREMKNTPKKQSHARVHEQLFEFYYLLKKMPRSSIISNWISSNQDCIKKSIVTSAHEYCGYTLLHFAVLCNNKYAVDRLLLSGADYAIKNEKGQTPLHLGMAMIAMHKRLKMGDSEKINMISILRHIFPAKNCINAYDNMGLSHLHIACYLGDYYLVEDFLIRGENLYMNDRFIKFDSPYWPGCTVIHVAFKYPKLRIIRLLGTYDVNIMASKDAFGLYPIHYAIQKCDGRMKDFLYSSPEIHFLDSLKNIGLLPIHDLCTVNRFFYSENEYNLQFRENVNAAISSDSPIWAGYTPLHIAIDNECERLINILIVELGANVKARDVNGISALQLAIRKQLIDYNITHAILTRYNINASKPINGDLEGLYLFSFACMQRTGSFRLVLLENKSIINKIVPAENPFDLPGYSPLHCSVEAGIIENVELLMRNGADPCIEDANQMTPLHLAVLRKKISIAKIICSYHGNVTKNPINASGLSHMHIACLCDKTSLVKEFLDYGEMVNLSTKNGQVPLHFAVNHGSETTVKLLLEHNADFTAQDINGLTPLHLAMRGKKISIVDMILRFHSEKIVNPVSSTGLSHFHVACTKNKVNLVENFLKSGLVNHDPVRFDSDFFAGFTPLHFAVYYKCVDIVRLLLNKGASVSAQNAMKKLPLHYISDQNRQECRLILDLLWMAMKSNCTEPIGTTGLTLLHIACISNDRPAIEQILKQDLDSINQSTGSDCPRWPGYSPLHFSAKYGDAESIKLLLSHNRNLVHSTDIHGFTPLHVACSSSKLENVEQLLTDGSDPFKNALNNLTPLRLGAKNTGIVQSILSQPFVHNQAAMACFHLAIFKNNLNFVKRFLEAGANPNEPIRTMTRYIKFTGWKPLSFAVYRQDCQLAEMLLSYGAKVEEVFITQTVVEKNSKLVKLLLRYKNDVSTLSSSFRFLINKCYRVKLLLEAGAVVHNDEIRQCIVESSQCGGNEEFWRETIISLLEHGFELDGLNNDGKSLLHLAYYPENLHLLRALLRCGADVDTEDLSGRTVVSYHLEIRTSRMNLQELRSVIFGHLRLRHSVPGFELSQSNEELYKTILDEEQLTNDSAAVDTADELETMLQMRFGGYVSLYQMFRQPETVMAWCLENVELCRFLATKRLEESFPLCSCLVRMQYGKALRRKRLLEPATLALDQLLFDKLEEARGRDICLRVIVDHLDNQDLRNLAAMFR
ncbi:hypothetical protein TSAR_005193 [Trichomalopsis sarcophagae]|uniref:Uncharacterized protein n=1 Tax=Trichomalopsis sarcophagae TaxID=543379 RepID=A0A232FA90_9HYME|nr:hypothetical protein TSAR_005193 [Trichomalopsis sarcophagae]